MNKSSQIIEWLQDSEYANKTKVSHMFWVDISDSVVFFNNAEKGMWDLCREIESYILDELKNSSSPAASEWFVNYDYSTVGKYRCYFTKLPSFNDVFHENSYCDIGITKLQTLLKSYKQVDESDSGKIDVTDCTLSWLHRGTGLQWTSFSYLYSDKKNHTDLLNKISYAGHTDWRIPSISEIKTMLSADKWINSRDEHPILGSLPEAMPLPINQTPKIHPSSEWLQGFYLFDKETTVTTGIRYNRDDEKIEDGGRYWGKFIAVRGEKKLQRNFQTGWSGTLLAWLEKNMNTIEQGTLPASSYAWKRLETLYLKGEHLKNNDYNSSFAAMKFLENLKTFSLTVDEHFQKVPEQLYELKQLKKIKIKNVRSFIHMPNENVWSISHLSSDIKQMINLEDIYFDNQKELTFVPDELFELPNLTTLNFSGCWELTLTAKQVELICHLVESGVQIIIPPLKLNEKKQRTRLLNAVKDYDGKINWRQIKELASDK